MIYIYLDWSVHMKRFLCLLLLLTLALSLGACGREDTTEEENKPVTIVTTVFPAYDFARQIAGERAAVCLLVPPGAEAHSFEPTARDILRIQSCTLFFRNGGESEAWVEELLEDRDVETLAMLDCVDALEEETKEGMQLSPEHEHGHDDHDHEEDEGPEYDEHVWTSPVNAIRICEALCERLCALDPEGAALYRANLAAYRTQLEELDAAFRSAAEQGSTRTVVFADRFPVRYFVEEYGLDYFAAFPGCADDTEPAARTVAFLIDKVRQEKIPAVFYIEFSNEKMADVICEDTGCRKLLFHSCHNVSARELEQGVTYLELMRGNVDALKEALG